LEFSSIDNTIGSKPLRNLKAQRNKRILDSKDSKLFESDVQHSLNSPMKFRANNDMRSNDTMWESPHSNQPPGRDLVGDPPLSKSLPYITRYGRVVRSNMDA